MKSTFALTALVFIASQVTAQHKYSQVFEYFPGYLEGFVTDPPLYFTEDDGEKRYTNVSQMYYRPDGKVVLEIILKDFSLNPRSYEESLKDLQNTEVSYSLQNGRPFQFQKYQAMERRMGNVSNWVMFLGENIILEIKQIGEDDDHELIIHVVNTLNIDAMKLAFAATRDLQ